MHVPTLNISGSIVPLTGVELSLHEYVSMSWHVLMPYTLLGGAIMVYSQVRFISGQHSMRKNGKPTVPRRI